jgi:DtxR family transcriptional regulator, Mn-dependent transcriptional regulator
LKFRPTITFVMATPETHVTRHGIAPGDHLAVVDKQPFEGPLFVRFHDRVRVLGGALAQAMGVEVDR